MIIRDGTDLIILASLNTAAQSLRLGSLLDQVYDGLGDAMHFKTTQHADDSSTVRIAEDTSALL